LEYVLNWGRKGGERGKGTRRGNDEVKEKEGGERKERGRKGKRKRTREGGREK
jgi:hypothetical protein